MDPDFMANLTNIFKNGNIPDDVKEKVNAFMNQNTTSNNQNNVETQNHTDTSSSGNSINPEMLKNFMNMFQQANMQNNNNSNTNHTQEQTSNSMPNIDMNMLLKMKSIMDKMGSTKDDPRSNLLLSLKPYLKESRKSKVEQYVQLFHMTKIMGAINENGGEKTK